MNTTKQVEKTENKYISIIVKWVSQISWGVVFRTQNTTIKSLNIKKISKSQRPYSMVPWWFRYHVRICSQVGQVTWYRWWTDRTHTHKLWPDRPTPRPHAAAKMQCLKQYKNIEKEIGVRMSETAPRMSPSFPVELKSWAYWSYNSTKPVKLKTANTLPETDSKTASAHTCSINGTSFRTNVLKKLKIWTF